MIRGGEKYTHRILVEIFALVLFVLFMVPFAMVVLNSAKTSKEIISNALSWPENWKQLFTNIGLIFGNATVETTDRKSVEIGRAHV